MPPKRRQYGSGSIYQRADGRWVGAAMAGFTARGTRRRVTVVAATEAEAKRKLRVKMRDLETNGSSALDTHATVRTWAQTWLDTTVHTVRPATWTANRSAVNTWIIPAIGHRRLAQLTPGDIRTVHAAIRARGLKASTIVRTHGVLSKMLHDALTEGHAVPPRVTQIRPPRANETDRDAIPLPDAIALLTKASEQQAGSRWAAALLQGMRQGECLGLTWSLVDLDRGLLDVSWQLQALPYVSGRAGRLRVPDGYEYRQLDGALCLVRPKTQRGQRIIPLVPWMTAALTSWRERAPASPHDLVWPRPDGRPALAPEDRGDWYALQDAAQVAHVDGNQGRRYMLHENRHTCATLLLEAGVDPEVVKAILGHSSIAISRGYQHVKQDMTRGAMERIATRLQLN